MSESKDRKAEDEFKKAVFDEKIDTVRLDQLLESAGGASGGVIDAILNIPSLKQNPELETMIREYKPNMEYIPRRSKAFPDPEPIPPPCPLVPLEVVAELIKAGVVQKETLIGVLSGGGFQTLDKIMRK